MFQAWIILCASISHCEAYCNAIRPQQRWQSLSDIHQSKATQLFSNSEVEKAANIHEGWGQLFVTSASL